MNPALHNNKTKKGGAHILIIQTAYLGDCILTVPLINSIKRSNSCEISVISRPVTEGIFESCPSVDEVICYDKNGKDRSFLPVIRLVNKIRKKNFEIVFLPQRSFRSGLIAFFSGIPERIGFKRGGAKFFCTKKICFDWNRHEVDRMLSLAEAAGYKKIACDFNLKPDLDIANKFLKTGKKIIGICPQSKWQTKCWPEDRFAELIKILSNDFQVVVMGEKTEVWEGESVINLTGKTSVKELVSVISMLDMMVSNDSGLMHLAAAFNIPVITIFGPTLPGMGFAPYGDIHTIIEIPLKCRPCGLHGTKSCPEKHFKCMLEIPVDRVKDEVYKKLGHR